MARQHREFHLQLEDAVQLRHCVHSATSKNKALDEALGKARARSKSWEWKAKEGIEKATRAKKDKDEAKEEAQVAWLAVVTAGDAKARVEVDLAWV